MIMPKYQSIKLGNVLYNKTKNNDLIFQYVYIRTQKRLCNNLITSMNEEHFCVNHVILTFISNAFAKCFFGLAFVIL